MKALIPGGRLKGMRGYLRGSGICWIGIGGLRRYRDIRGEDAGNKGRPAKKRLLLLRVRAGLRVFRQLLNDQRLERFMKVVEEVNPEG